MICLNYEYDEITFAILEAVKFGGMTEGEDTYFYFYFYC